jgi:hypothetical protein
MPLPPKDPGTTTTPTDPKEIIKSYFGENAKILGKETRNGKEYYKVQSSYQSTCADFSTSTDKVISSSSADFNQTMVSVVYADAKDFSIDGESLYLDNSSSRNLLYTRNTTELTKNIGALSEVIDEFTFTYAKPVHTIDASDFQYEKEYRKAVLDYLQSNMTQVVYLTGKYSLQTLSSSYVTVVPDREMHLIDRAFYSNKAFGSAMYEDAKDMFKPYQESGKSYPKVQMSYAGNGDITWLNISEVSGTLTGRDALVTLGIEDTNFIAKGEVKILVADETVTAQVFEQVQSANTSPGSTGVEGEVEGGVPFDPALQTPEQIMPREDARYRDVYIVFKTGDVTVIAQSGVMSSVTNASLAKSLSFGVVGTTDRALLDKMLKVAVEVVSDPKLLMR